MGNIVAGRGINDADYVVQKSVDSKSWQCPYYTAWCRMLRTLEPVDHKWLKFSGFKKWMVKQKWEGMLLDRWLYGDGELFSPETCCFIDRYSSNLAKGLRSSKPVGIDSPHGMGAQNPYRVSMHGNHIGYFKTLRGARKAWCDVARDRLKKRLTNRKHKEAADRLYGDSIKALSNFS
jgi:hypothetical protein